MITVLCSKNLIVWLWPRISQSNGLDITDEKADEIKLAEKLVDEVEALPKFDDETSVENAESQNLDQTEEEKIDEIIKASKELLSSELSKEIAEKTAQEIKSNQETNRHKFQPLFKLSRSTSLDSLVPLETGS